jgi:hypothetical protein
MKEDNDLWNAKNMEIWEGHMTMLVLAASFFQNVKKLRSPEWVSTFYITRLEQW